MRARACVAGLRHEGDVVLRWLLDELPLQPAVGSPVRLHDLRELRFVRRLLRRQPSNWAGTTAFTVPMLVLSHFARSCWSAKERPTDCRPSRSVRQNYRRFGFARNSLMHNRNQQNTAL